MNPTKIKRKDLNHGDMFCEITAMADRPVMIAFKDGDDPVFDQSVFERDVHRIDMPDYTHELTRFSWKRKALDDKVEATITRNKHDVTEYVSYRCDKCYAIRKFKKYDGFDTCECGGQKWTVVECGYAGISNCPDCRDAIADLRVQVKELTEENDSIRDAVNKEGSLADNAVHDVEELHTRLNECRNAKQTLQVIIDTLESEVEKLRMKIFDIKGREDLVTTELEKENRNLKEDVAGKTEIIRQWKNNWCPAKCAEKQKTIDELISDKTILQDTIQKMIVAECGDQTRTVGIIASKSAKIEMLSTKLAECHDAFVGRGDDSPITIMRRHIAELEELHDIDAQAWSKRESDLLQMVEDRDTVIGRQRTSIQGLILSRGEKDELIGEMQFDLDHSIKSNELLNVMLKIVNPIIKNGDYSNVESSRFLSIEMFKLCRDVIAFRRSHNIV